MEKKKKSIKNDNKKKYIIMAVIYFLCSVLWLVEGYIKSLNDINPYYLDYIASALLMLLGLFYLYRIRIEK